MSKKDLLSKDEMAHAEKHGWIPRRVYDLATSKWLVCLFAPVGLTPPAIVAGHVMARARSGDAVAVKSLQLLTGMK